MKLTWLSGAALLLKLENITVLVNPVYKISGVTPDVVVVTNAGARYSDTEVLKEYLERGITVLSGERVYSALGERPSSVLLAPHSVWSERGVTFYSVKAESSDRTAIGVIIDDGERTYYVAGGTLYNFDVIDDCLDLAPDGVDVAVVPISGSGCTMNARDAADFAYEIGAKCAVPVDYDATGSTADAFDFDDGVILSPGVESEL
ncbi:MAG: MBL fold metallo-hydrolase [Clostridia bacterium]|nr:MBL fold metallo-hydrolase [Clostridia bacterium]